MSLTENSMVLMPISPNTENGRSISPLTPSPSKELRGLRLFRAITRRLARSSQDELNNVEEDSRSSSTDSSSSTDVGHSSRSKKSLPHVSHSCSSSAESGFRSVSPKNRHASSSSSSDAGSDICSKSRQSSSAENIRRVFQNLTLQSSERSKSCNRVKENKRKKIKTPPKRILRSPVTYTYIKGLSGLPTQRIPKTLPSMYTSNSCNGCNVQYMVALHR